MASGADDDARPARETLPKPMICVLGAPLVERNLLALLRAGVREVAVVVAASGDAAPLVTQWASGRGRALAGATGGRLEVVVEPAPMGNAGGLTLVGGSGRTLLLVFANTLTSLDLSGLAEAHVRAWADLTLAVHSEELRLPYGIVEHKDGVVTGYRDKPVLGVPVASGVAVVGPRALATLARGTAPTEIADLVQRAVDAGLAVRAVPDQAARVDVDDTQALERAVALVRADPDAFELCWTDPVPRTTIPGTGGIRLQIDDVDPGGRPCRVELPVELGLDALEALDALGAGAATRVRAWLD